MCCVVASTWPAAAARVSLSLSLSRVAVAVGGGPGDVSVGADQSGAHLSPGGRGLAKGFGMYESPVAEPCRPALEVVRRR